MLLDRLLSKLDVRVEFVSVCLVSSGWRLRLPGPPFAMLHFVLAGSGTLRTSGGRTVSLKPGMLAVVPRHSGHVLGSGEHTQREHLLDLLSASVSDASRISAGNDPDAALTVACGLVRVRYGSALGLFDQLRDTFVEDLSQSPRVERAFEDLLVEQADPGPGSTAMQTALMSQCLILLLRQLCERGECGLPWISALQDTRLARALERILDDPAKPHTVELLAGEAAMSRSAFAESFAKAFGIPPMTMVQRIRMERALLLLEHDSSLSMDSVARRVGYSSRSHFSRSFKKVHGIPPTAVRILDT